MAERRKVDQLGCLKHNKKFASIFTKNWQEQAQHSEIYTGRVARKNTGVMDHRECQAKSLIFSYRIDKKVTLGYLELLAEIRNFFTQVNYDGRHKY